MTGFISQPEYVFGGVQVAPPVHTGWDVPPATVDVDTTIGQLADVDASPGQVGLLERQSDQVVRPVTREAILGPHIDSPTPHPAYDDLPSLTLLFENRLA